MRYFLPRHGRTHCPGGSDPIPCLGVIGEAYKDLNQTITSSSYTQLTNWDNWTIQDEAFISQQVNGLGIETNGYYLITAMAGWLGIGNVPVNAIVAAIVGSLSVGEEFDTFTSETMQGDASGGGVNRVFAPTYIEAGKIVTVWVYHETASSLDVYLASLKIVRLPVPVIPPYWAPL